MLEEIAIMKRKKYSMSVANFATLQHERLNVQHYRVTGQFCNNTFLNIVFCLKQLENNQYFMI